MSRSCLGLVVLMLLGSALPARGEAPLPSDFRPDPLSVQRYGPAYRYPQAGWIVLHIEGEPYERGYQHGRLLAAEIAGYVRCLAAVQSSKGPADGWNLTRALVNSLFLRRYDKEYLEEMKGIADGATAAGARFDNRPIDLVDIVGLNSLFEYETLPSALEATPTGLEGIRFPGAQPRAMPAPKPMHCSAFAATGPATADGRAIIGHITMFSLYPSLFYNVWLDVKPSRGHRVHMQTYPAGIQSGFDYYLNDAGIAVVETTIRQTRFDIQGMALASRIRQALQYGDSIDQVVDYLSKGNNGLYTNEWLMADAKTDEIAMFELGTHKTKLYRSRKNDWFGGTEGFYWGCNNAKDLQVRLETIPGVNDRPANFVWRPSARDQKWLQLYHKYKGRIDADFGKIAFTTPPLAAYHSVDAKFTTSNMAKEMKSWALYGPPLGRTWQPTPDEKSRYPEVRPMASNPWTVIHGVAPAKPPATGVKVADLPDRMEDSRLVTLREAVEEERPVATPPAWRGTILPKTDADSWLAAAFADYERYVAGEKAHRERAKDGDLPQAVRERLALNLNSYRSDYLAAVRASRDVPLAQTHADFAQDYWYRIAAGKGVCLLHSLRQILGESDFEEMMDAFGQAHAGKEVTTQEFQKHLSTYVDKHGAKVPVQAFLDYWLNQPGLPKLQLTKTTMSATDKGSKVEGAIAADSQGLPIQVEVVVETTKGETRKTVRLDAAETAFHIETDAKPIRVVIDKYGRTPKSNGGIYSVLAFQADLEETCIVYGTADETPTNRETAEALQRALIERGPNITVPIKADREVTDDDLKSHHLLLIGRPDSNRVVERFRSALPVAFGSRSFTVDGASYAHASSAVIAAGSNPLNERYSIVVLAGLCAESTLRTPNALLRGASRAGEVLILANGARPRSLLVPARDLVQQLQLPK